MKNQFSKLSVVAIIALLLFSGCKKETTKPAPTALTSTTTTVESTYFLQGNFGGEAIHLQTTPEPFTASFSNVADTEGEDHEHNVEHHENNDENDAPLVTGTRWSDNSSTDLLSSTTGSIEFRKVVIRVFIAPLTIPQQHYEMLAVGSTIFANAETLNNGAYVTFRDNAGVLWTSKGDQTGSAIAITSRGEFAGAATTVAGTFSAKMYDGNGNVRQLNNVSFHGIAGL